MRVPSISAGAGFDSVAALQAAKTGISPREAKAKVMARNIGCVFLPAREPSPLTAGRPCSPKTYTAQMSAKIGRNSAERALAEPGGSEDGFAHVDRHHLAPVLRIAGDVRH